MASPSTWRWSWKTTTGDFTTRISSSCCSPPTVYFSFSFCKRNSRRSRLNTFSLADSSSPSSPILNKGKINSPQMGNSVDGFLLILCGDEEQSDSIPLRVGRKDKSHIHLSHKKFERSSNSLFGKRPLWRRILFASKKVRSIILLNVLTIIYASDVSVLKEVQAMIDPAAFTFVRFAMSAIPFIPFILQSQGDARTRNAGIELGVWVSLGYLMQALGLLTSDAGRASFLSLFTVIIVPLLDGMLGAVVPARTWFGALMSLLGVAMLESSGSPPCVGDLLNFLSAVFFGIHMLRTEHISRTTKEKNFLALLGYEVSVVAFLSMIWYFVGGWGGIQEWDPESWTWKLWWDWMITFPWIPALYTGVFSTGLCLWVEMAAMRDVSATETAIIYGLEPLWGAGFAWFLLGERWGTIGWIGAAIILGGSLTVQVFGSLSPSKFREDKESSGKDDQILLPDKLSGLSTSPVVVSSRKNVPDILRK